MGHDYCDYLIDLLAPWGRVAAKRMFGGFGLYYDGRIFSIVIEDTPYFKVDDTNRADYEALGTEPFSYETKEGSRTVMSYWQVPADILDDQDALVEWTKKACRVALAAEQAKKKPKPKVTPAKRVKLKKKRP